MRTRLVPAVAVALLAVAWSARAQEAPEATARLTLERSSVPLATPFAAEIRVSVPAGWTIPGEPPGPAAGDVSVIDGAWEEPVEREGRAERRWRGRMAAYRLGEVSVPPFRLTMLAPDGSARAVATDAVVLHVTGSLEEIPEGAAPPEIADLKPPAVVPPDYRRLRWALAGLALLAAVAAAAWWGARRLAGRFARVEVDTDPFRRMQPDAWAFEALGALLDRRLAEQGQEDLFHEELSRIVKRYLSGRYRVDLMERTTGELGPALRRAGMEPGAAAEALALLERADLAKFARASAGPDGCRKAVEAAYGIVDRTRVRPAETTAGEAA